MADQKPKLPVPSAADVSKFKSRAETGTGKISTGGSLPVPSVEDIKKFKSSTAPVVEKKKPTVLPSPSEKPAASSVAGLRPMAPSSASSSRPLTSATESKPVAKVEPKPIVKPVAQRKPVLPTREDVSVIPGQSQGKLLIPEPTLKVPAVTKTVTETKAVPKAPKIDKQLMLDAIAAHETRSKPGENKVGMPTKLKGSARGTYQIIEGTLRGIYNQTKEYKNQFKTFDDFEKEFNKNPSLERDVASNLLNQYDHLGIHAMGAWYNPDLAAKAASGSKKALKVVPNPEYGNRQTYGQYFNEVKNIYNKLFKEKYNTSPGKETKEVSRKVVTEPAVEVPSLEKFNVLNPNWYGGAASKEDVDILAKNTLQKSKEVANNIKLFNSDATAYANDVKSFNALAKANPKNPELPALQQKLNQRKAIIDKQHQDLQSGIKQIDQAKMEINRQAIANYEKKSKQGNWGGFTWNKIVEGLGYVQRGLQEQAALWSTLGAQTMDLFGVKPEELKKKPWLLAGGGDMYREEKLREFQEKTKSYNEDLKAKGTTPEYMQELEKESSWARALGGVAVSAPAMLGGLPVMTIQGIGSFYDQIDKDPVLKESLKGVPKEQLDMVALPIAFGTALLERAGLRTVLGKGAGPVASILAKVFKKIPKNAPMELIESTFKKIAQTEAGKIAGKVASSRAGKIAGRFVAGAKGEAETEVEQGILEDEVKRIYNFASGNDAFKLADFASKEYRAKRVEEAKLGAMGSLILGAPIMAVQSIAQGKQVTDDDYVAMRDLLMDPEQTQLTRAKLALDVVDEKMTPAQAKAKLDEDENARKILRSIPDNLSVTQQRQAFAVLLNNSKLQAQLDDMSRAIQGKDPNLVTAVTSKMKEVQSQIDANNKQLTKISENAVQEQTTSEVPVQPEAGTSLQVAEGESQAEPQVTTQEGQEKQKQLEYKVEEINSKINALRSEDGSIPTDKIDEFNQLKTELLNAKNATKRGNTENSIVIKKFKEGADTATSNPEQLSENEKAEAADIIEQVIQNSKTAEEALSKIQRLGYVFNLNDTQILNAYLNDRFDSNAPQIGNNKDSFQSWVNGKTDTQPQVTTQEGQGQEVAPTEQQIEGQKLKDIYNNISEFDTENRRLDLNTDGISLRVNPSDYNTYPVGALDIYKGDKVIGSLGLRKAKKYYGETGLGPNEIKLNDNDVVLDVGPYQAIQIFDKNNRKKGIGTKVYLGIDKYINSKFFNREGGEKGRLISNQEFTQSPDSYFLWKSLYEKGLAKIIANSNGTGMEFGDDIGEYFDGKPDGRIFTGNIYALDLDNIYEQPTPEPVIATVDVTTPTKFEEGKMPEMSVDQIDWEASGMGTQQEAIDKFGGINDITVVDVQEKNDKGQYVGRVRVLGQDNSKEGVVVFKDPNATQVTEEVAVEETTKDPKFEAAKQMLKDKGVYPTNARVNDIVALSESKPGEVTAEDIQSIVNINNTKAKSIASAMNKQFKEETKQAAEKAKIEEQRKPKPKVDKPTAEVTEAAALAGVSATGLWSLFKINKEVFGLGNKEALASAIVMDRVIGTMAKRDGITKEQMMEKIVFKKSDISELSDQALFQKAYHGGASKFNKFSTGKIGSGTNARFGGWGLYFTLDKGRANTYASQLKNDDIEIGDFKIPKSDYMYNDLKKIFEKTNSVIGVAKELLKLSELNKEKAAKALNDEFDGRYKEYDAEYEKASFDVLNGVDVENSKKIIKDFQERYEYAENGLYGMYNQLAYEYRKLARTALSEGAKLNNQPAYTYEVSIADDLNLLDFDKEISEDNYNRILSQAIKEDSKFVQAIIKNKGETGRKFYFNITNEAFNPNAEGDVDEDLSMLMLRAGIDGNTMRSEGTQDIILFDENAIEINDVIQFQQGNQGAQAAMQIAQDGKYIIHALTDPNVSSPLHELAHVYEHYLTNKERREILKWAGKKDWDTSVSEKFARGFENWLATGKAPSSGLTKVFAQFKAWLTDIYKGIKDSEIDIQLNPAMKKIYSTMVSEKGRKVSPPSAKKILGIKPDMVTVNEAVARNEQIRLEIKAAKGAVKAVQEATAKLVADIKALGQKGVLTPAQTRALLNGLNSNLLNPVIRDRVFARAKRIIENANYAKNVEEGNSIREKIKTLLKADKKKPREQKIAGTVVNMANEFAKLSPKMVDDIDLYLERANEVLAAIRNPKITDMDITGRIAADINAVNEYSKSEFDKQEEARKDEMLAQYEYLVEAGVLDKSMSLKDINKVIAEIMKGDKVDNAKLKEAGLVFYRTLFNDYAEIIKKMLSGIDPITGERTNISEGDKELVRRFININPENISDFVDMFNMANAAQEFITNGIIDNMEVMIRHAKGKEEVRKDAANPKMRGYKAILPWIANVAKIPLITNIINTKIAPVQEYLRNVFRGDTNAAAFEKNSGFTDIVNGSTKALNESDQTDKSYADTFQKKKPNGKKYFDISNVFERGIFADLLRTTPGTAEEVRAEFVKKKQQLELTIEEKKNSDKKSDNREAVELQKAYDKIVKGSNNINDVMSKMAQENIDGVMWWINTWDQGFDKIDRASKALYNTVLERQNNYTPESWVKIADKATQDDDVLSRTFNRNNTSYLDTRRAGTLMKYNGAPGLPKNEKTGEVTHIKSYHFDINNSESFAKTLKDVYTAPGMVQYMAYVNSPEFSTIIPDKKTRDNLKQKLAFAINSLKDSEVDISPDYVKQYNKAMKKFVDISRAQALVSVKTPILQTVPVVAGTAVDLVNDPASFAQGLALTGNMDFHRALNKAGFGISVRGLEAIAALDAAEKRIAESRGVDLGLFSNVAKLGNLQLKWMLSKPDIIAARQAWAAYYIHKLKKMGINTSNIDWNTHEFNQEAADYAERKTNSKLNQNIKELSGEMFASRSQTNRAIRNTILNFASFAYNMKYRFWTDMVVLGSVNSNTTDKADAAKDIVRTVGEAAGYIALGSVLSYWLKEGIYNLVGYDEPEEEKKKADEYLINNIVTRGITDLLSPMPGIGDLLFVKGVNSLLDFAFGEQEKEEPNREKLFYVKARPEVEKQFRLYEPPEKTEAETYLSLLGGMSSIYGKNIYDVYKSINLMHEGEQFQVPNPNNPNKPIVDKTIEYKDKFDNKIEFSNKEKEMMKIPFVLQSLGAIGLGFRDQAESARKVRGSLEKRAKKRMATSKREKLFYVPKAE